MSWITFGALERASDGTTTSPVASLRYRVLIPIRELDGIAHRVVAVRPDATGDLRAQALDADVAVFSKSFSPANQTLAREARARGLRVIFDICDNHYDDPRFGAACRAMTALADRVVCNTEAMAAAAGAYASRPPVVVEDPYEGPAGAAGYAPGATLRLLWFGHPSNLDSLQAAMPDLAEVSRRRPLSLTLLTQVTEPLAAECRRVSARFQGRLDMSARPWSLEAQWAELAACDVVIIPSHEDPRNTVKSANRMVEALRAGRPVASQPMPAYRPFDRWTPVRPTLSEGLAWLDAHAADAPALVTEAQRYIEGRYAPAIVAEGWRRVIADDGPEGR
ncbi:hypothetical protein [Phenylobacterium sp.]|uniref:glycosyltransferase n=1 Tax=Phenylobacterium sp. TaxID=1871053 RepID=UPI0025EB42D2|nr:hypothetical protein [Phenylobacterium sp.]